MNWVFREYSIVSTLIIGIGIQDVSARIPGRAERYKDIEVGGRRADLLGTAAQQRRAHSRVFRLPRGAKYRAEQ